MEKSNRTLRSILLPVIHNMKLSTVEIEGVGIDIFGGTNNKENIPALLDLLEKEKANLPEHKPVYIYSFKNPKHNNKRWALDQENNISTYTNTKVKELDYLVTGNNTGYEYVCWYSAELT